MLMFRNDNEQGEVTVRFTVVLWRDRERLNWSSLRSLLAEFLRWRDPNARVPHIYNIRTQVYRDENYDGMVIRNARASICRCAVRQPCHWLSSSCVVLLMKNHVR